ncbi:MAG: DUF2288 family protein [Spirulinaceae cyanobacterium SM2_1_0]|nr:DUF2288 family protein [Spirulinaceae cyanobacterium SM2_1_0]
MQDDLRGTLAENLDEAVWTWLAPHVQRESVFVVAGELDLLTVGEAIACDDVSRVQTWLQTAQLGKPTANQLDRWTENPETRFTALIVQPFVLVQEQAA